MELNGFASSLEAAAYERDIHLWARLVHRNTVEQAIRLVPHYPALSDTDRKEFFEVLATALSYIPEDDPVVISTAVRNYLFEVCDNGTRGIIERRTALD